MKKMPRKFSEGGAAQTKPAEPKKPVDTTPDWAKKDLKDKNADAKTQQGYEAATAKDRLKKFKKGGSIKRFAEGGGKFSESDPGIYERARKYVASKNDEEAGPAGAIKEPPGAEKAKPKAAAKPAAKPAAKKDENYSNEGRSSSRPTSTKSEDSSSAPFKSVSERMKEARESTRRAEGSTTDTRSVSERISQAVEENPKTVAALGIGAGMIPAGRLAQLGYRGLQALRAARAARTAKPVPKPARDLDEMRFADEGNPNFKRGGKVAKYAKGGGVESRGKTKGTVVKMAKGGSVKGYGIARGAKACKMV